MSSWLFLAAALVGAWFTFNGLRPMGGASRRATLSFFAGWLTTELALHHLAWQALMTVVFVRAGALQRWPGVVALGVTLASWAGLVRCWRAAGSAEHVVEDALQAALGPGYRDAILPVVRDRFAPAVDWRQILLPFPLRHPDVERTRDIVYAREGGVDLRLDVYRSRTAAPGGPVL